MKPPFDCICALEMWKMATWSTYKDAETDGPIAAKII
jgi:hypothetical protein